MIKRIPDCYWPGVDQGTYVSHEAVCILNDTKEDVQVELTLYFEDRPRQTGYRYQIPAERTLHIRMDRAVNAQGQTVPRDTPYAMTVEMPMDLALQYTRVDTTQGPLALMSTMV